MRLKVDLASEPTMELRLGEHVVPTVSQTADLDGSGTAEVLLFSNPGGDGGWHDVFTWDGDTLTNAPPAPGSPKDLVEDDSLATVAEFVGAEVVDGQLFSWVSTGDTSAPSELRVWTRQPDGQRLVATEVEGPQSRTLPGRYPELR